MNVCVLPTVAPLNPPVAPANPPVATLLPPAARAASTGTHRAATPGAAASVAITAVAPASKGSAKPTRPIGMLTLFTSCSHVVSHIFAVTQLFHLRRMTRRPMVTTIQGALTVNCRQPVLLPMLSLSLRRPWSPVAVRCPLPLPSRLLRLLRLLRVLQAADLTTLLQSPLLHSRRERPPPALRTRRRTLRHRE